MSLDGAINVAKLGQHFEFFVQFDAQFCEHDFDPLTSRYK